MSFHPTSKDIFFSKNDPSDRRLGSLVKPLSDWSQLSSGDLLIAGYPDDEGIALSGGRVGASAAPQLIRKHLYKMTPPLNQVAGDTHGFWDFGDLDIQKPLKDRHELASLSATTALKKSARWVALGGGHDYAFADGMALLQSNERPLIINFDAHLDVRPLDHGLSSGTGFYRLLSQEKGFDFAQIGIQSQCNSSHHLAWAKSKGTRVLQYDEIMASGESFAITCLKFLEHELLKKRVAYVSIDIDGFSNSFAPGCSQGFATGFGPEDFIRVFDILCTRLDIRVLGIYEVSPPLDSDERTSKLAAQILHRYLKAYLPKSR
jgi:formiminoglutamase